MPPLKSLMSPRLRGDHKSRSLKTPEPFANLDSRPASPPRQRFRLRRRNASQQHNPPTQQFLASVAAADVPIPSIEEPRLSDEDMVDTASPVRPQLQPGYLGYPQEEARGRAISPPKTPVPRSVPSLSPKRFPNWSIESTYSSLESSPECDSSRPSTAQSTQTSASLFSRYSINSDDFSQFCPDPEEGDRFGDLLSVEDAQKAVKSASGTSTSKKRSRKAPWTRPMSHHLWSTFMMYMQDPNVTPFRIGKSGIPPQGVCTRVAREAKRSWKGSKAQHKPGGKSASATPTIDAPGSYVQWPHSCAATRAHLRELCKSNASATARGKLYSKYSPAPFGNTATLRTRRVAPFRSPSVFSGSDMALSLAVSTCESMQPNGPLAQLTASQPGPLGLEAAQPLMETGALAPPGNACELERARLGSPFMARSYGPSSTNSIADTFGVTEEPRRQSHTVGTRRGLGSPARLSNSRQSTQKRRSKQSALEPKRKRPTLSLDFWTDPTMLAGISHRDTPFSEFSSTASNQRDALFVPRANLQELFEASASGDKKATTTESLAPPTEMPDRLGSPFTGGNTSFSFPTRRSSSISVIDFSAIRRPFASVQRPTDVNTTPTKSSLRSRLAYIDERLKDFRRRDNPRRRSQSPL